MNTLSPHPFKHKLYSFLLLLAAVLIACIALAFLAYAYYDDARYLSALERVYPGSQFSIGQGKGRRTGDSLVMSAPGEAGLGFIELSGVDVQLDRYEGIEIYFSATPASGSLSIGIRHTHENGTWGQSLQVRADRSAIAMLPENLPKGTSLSTLAIIHSGPMTGNMILDRVVFQPYARSMGTFLSELGRSFQLNTIWTAASINMHKPNDNQLLIPQKPLILVISCLATLIYVMATLGLGIPMFHPGILLVILPWIAIDAHYFIEQIFTAQNTYNTFHKSHNRDALASPHIYDLANTINEAIDEDRAYIRVYTGEQTAPLKQEDNSLRYLDGRLKYYLLPHNTYTRYKKIPEDVMRRGNFYLANISGKPFAYLKQRHTLLYLDHMLDAEKLIDSRQLQLFKVHGSRATD